MLNKIIVNKIIRTNIYFILKTQNGECRPPTENVTACTKSFSFFKNPLKIDLLKTYLKTHCQHFMQIFKESHFGKKLKIYGSTLRIINYRERSFKFQNSNFFIYLLHFILILFF